MVVDGRILKCFPNTLSNFISPRDASRAWSKSLCWAGAGTESKATQRMQRLGKCSATAALCTGFSTERFEIGRTAMYIANLVAIVSVVVVVAAVVVFLFMCRVRNRRQLTEKCPRV